jgi:hypothetical protein
MKMNQDMIHAYMSGQKTQTRRVIKPQPEPLYIGWIFKDKWTFAKGNLSDPKFMSGVYSECPYGQPGDELQFENTCFRTKITNIRVERVQDISLADAEAEGIHRYRDGNYKIYTKTSSFGTQNPGASFKSLWDSMYEKRGFPWRSNPWVWVIEFERYEK